MECRQDRCFKNLEALMKAVDMENRRQIEKWGIQNVTSVEWLAYLTEEVGELAEAITKTEYDAGKTNNDVYKEAIQVATLALKIAEMFDETLQP